MTVLQLGTYGTLSLVARSQQNSAEPLSLAAPCPMLVELIAFYFQYINGHLYLPPETTTTTTTTTTTRTCL